MIADRLAELRQTIRETALSCNREPESIHLVAVSKRKSISDIRSAARAGQLIFGENHVQEAAGKKESCQDLPVSWHMIGHLQKNKVKRAAAVFDAIHSIDSIELAEMLNRAMQKTSNSMDCFIQVKLTSEETKTGIKPEDLPDMAARIQTLSNLRLIGLMGIPPYFPNPEEAAPFFRRLRVMRDELNRTTLQSTPISELSMGMSHDFRVAIREGATYIRIGTLLFGERSYDSGK